MGTIYVISWTKTQLKANIFWNMKVQNSLHFRKKSTDGYFVQRTKIPQQPTFLYVKLRYIILQIFKK